MKTLRITGLMVLFCSLFLLTSCFDDDTTLGTGTISEITIDSTSIAEVYNIDKNETLVINPVVSQTNPDKPLSYTWEMEL